MPSRIPSTGSVILEQSSRAFEGQAVLNPGCIKVEDTVHMFYRAVREGNYSSVGYATYVDGELSHRAEAPVLMPEFDYERHGIEDPRIACIDGVYYLVYIAYDGLNARIAYATATELPHFTKQGVISPPMPYHEVVELCRQREHHAIADFFHRHFSHLPECRELLVYEKDAFLFPRKINGKFALVHRVFPNVQVIYFEEFGQLQSVDFWRENLYQLEEHTLLQPEHWFESRHIGGGCPPIETDAGWLFIYHAVEQREHGRVYHAAAALFDRNNPTRLIGRLDHPLFSPESDWELQGDVNDVVFPTGAVVEGDRLDVYYGAADSRIGMRTFSLSQLLERLSGGETATEAFEPEFSFAL